jgi:subtilisin family serine protease
LPIKLTVFNILFALLTASAANASPRYWVLLSDKGISPSELSASLARLESEIPDRARIRREKNSTGIDELDLPISEAYLTQLRDAGASIIAESRWLNAVSIQAGPDALKQIAGFPFVKAIQLVAAFRRDNTGLSDTAPISETELQRAYSDALAEYGVPLGDYGASYRQAELSGVIEAHRRGLTGAGVLVGMLDTGFQLTHRAFTGLELVAQYDFIHNDPDPSYDPLNDPPGQANHGTGCLSVLAGNDPGRLVGIAPRAAVALAKVEWTGSETAVEEDYWVAGLEWLEWLGAEVVTSSLTYRDWYSATDMDGLVPLVSRAAERAAELGVVLCNAAGNNGPGEITIGAPADAAGILAVAATDSTGAVTKFSSRGPSADGRIKPDVAAMGKGVIVATPLTRHGYSRWNGTSLATPIVAGVAALVLEAHPDWTAAEVVEAIRASSDRWFMPDNALGFGVVDAAEAVDYK